MFSEKGFTWLLTLYQKIYLTIQIHSFHLHLHTGCALSKGSFRHAIAASSMYGIRSTSVTSYFNYATALRGSGGGWEGFGGGSIPTWSHLIPFIISQLE